MTSKPIQIPFDEKGRFLDFVRIRNGEPYKGIVWQDNFEFAGPVKVVGMERGRSAARYVIEVTPFVAPDPLIVDGPVRAIMFMTDFLAAIQKKGALPGGLIPGTFTFVKRGQNYGVKLVD